MKPILNIAGYQFVGLTQLADYKALLFSKAHALQLKGTVLLSEEGININLAGEEISARQFITELKQDHHFKDVSFRESYSDFYPFKQLKVKIKKEIITLRESTICPETARASALSPEQFKRWMDEGCDITVLDTRNDYEVRFGTFDQAVNLHLKDFSEFPKAIDSIDRKKPVVMFCTGGIRCEKAALVMQKAGFSEVYQLDGGILNYFDKIGGAHYHGDCFVFDQRIAVDPSLTVSGVSQCRVCQGPSQQAACPSCVNHLI